VLGLSRDECLWDVDEAEIIGQMWAHYEQQSGKSTRWGRSNLDRVSELIDQKIREAQKQNGDDPTSSSEA